MATTELTIKDMEGLWKTAAHISKSSFAPKEMRGKQDEVYAALLTGMELGLGPMAAMRHISVIDGRPSLSAAMQLALLRRAGHRIQVVESTASRCKIIGTAPDGTKLEISYELEEAKAAGLLGKTNWKTYPADMLWARCVSRYARRADAGATLGLYSPADWDSRDTVTLAPEEYAAVVSSTVDEAGTRSLFHAEPLEPGELPLRPGDEDIPEPVMISCPRCQEKVATVELRAHLEAQHAEGEQP